ncbi:MAG: hypothetical protein IPO91_07585 [Chloroflexi bacterium]|nr:hypothetical protein [Chloroflexota bacterium]
MNDGGLPQWANELKPSIRAKVYEIPAYGNVDLDAPITVDGLHINTQMNERVESARVFVVEFFRSPNWTSSNGIMETFFELVVLFWEEKNRLLFVNSSIGNELYFDRIARCVVANCGLSPVPLFRLQRVFGTTSNAQFVNVGMRNGTVGNANEAYRMLSGPNAHLAVTRTDSRTHIRGHAFAKGMFDEGITSLGFTDSGKIWSMNRASGVLELLQQFHTLAQRIHSVTTFTTNSELDSLAAGDVITAIPSDIVAASWHERFYSVYDFKLDDVSLLEWDLIIDRERATETELPVILSYNGISYRILYQVSPPHFSTTNSAQPIVLSNNVELAPLLNEYPLKFYTATQSLIMGSQVFLLQPSIPPFDPKKIQVQSWQNVDIEVEKGAESSGKISIHDFICNSLRFHPPSILFYDHDSGEIADFITIEQQPKQIKITLYHVKASSKDLAGARVEDLYEICGQAIKSVQWLKPQFIFDRLLRRENQDATRLIYSAVGTLEAFVATYRSNPVPVVFRLVLVQPGISKKKLTRRNPQTDKLLEILSSTEDYVRRAGDATLEVWTSA